MADIRDSKNWGFETKQLHIGQEKADPVTDARAVPIYASTSYVFHNSQHAADRFGLRDAGNIYGRLTNPTEDVFEQRIAALEGGVAALAVASGAAAVTYTIENLAQSGDHIVSAKNIYGGTFNLISVTMAKMGITATFVSPDATEEELNAIAHRLAKQITKDYEGKKLLLVGVLKGSVYFFTDLTRYIDLPCNIDFIQASSYGAGTVSSGNIQIIKDIADDLTGFDVLLVEDILDTGNTLKYIHDMLSKRNPESIGVVTLLDKPARRIADIKADYVGVDVPDAFVVGYGLDYDQYYRNLPYIGVLKKSIYEK